MWWVEGVDTPDEVDPSILTDLLPAFPAPDEAMCELPERCPGPVTAFVDPWTGAHAERELERSRDEIVQVNARGQRAWTYFSLMAIEGDAHIEYESVLTDAMRVRLDGTSEPLEEGSLQVHPARAAMWEYLGSAGEARISSSGYQGIDIDAGFYDTLCFDETTVSGFGPWLDTNLSTAEITAIEEELSEQSIDITIDNMFDYVDHLTIDRGFASEDEFGSEGRLLKIDRQWDRYINEIVFGFIDAYLSGLQSAATAAGQGDFPVFLNRSEGDAIWTAAETFTVLGGETFINDGNILYPTAHRMAPYFRQGRIFNKRVWSWNVPRILHPDDNGQIMDTALIYLAENDAAGGLLQIPDRSIKYPLCPEVEPLCDATDDEMDALWAKLGPYLTHRERIRDLLDQQNQADVLVLEMLGHPYSLWDNEAVVLDFAAMGAGTLLSDLQVNYEVSGWADGDHRHRLAETPWVTQEFLNGYAWVVLSEPEFLSDGQIAMLNTYMDQGGKLVVLMFADDTCDGASESACELVPGCRYEESTCNHVVSQLSGDAGVELFLVDDVNVIQYRDEDTHRSTARQNLATALGAESLPRELTSAADLTDLGVFHSADDPNTHIWHLVNYDWNEGTYTSVPRSATTIDVAIPASLRGQTVNVTWFSAPDERQELQSGITLGSDETAMVSIDLPAFEIWGTLVLTTGEHPSFADPRERPPYVKVSSYQPGSGSDWQFEFEAVSSHADLDRAYLWGRQLVEVEAGVWEPSGDWRAMAAYDFTEGGTVIAGRRQVVNFAIPRPNGLRFEFYATACDVNDLCQPFIPWQVMVRPPSP